MSGLTTDLSIQFVFCPDGFLLTNVKLWSTLLNMYEAMKARFPPARILSFTIVGQRTKTGTGHTATDRG